jgi:P-type Cu+ transporter
MGLATPIAILVGTNAAARRGILIRDGQALEKSGRLTAVVFDKTGTLTQGKVEVAAAEDARTLTERTTPLAKIAAPLAAGSNHPLSQAVARWGQAPSSPAALSDWIEHRGQGVQARSAQGLLRLGSLTWLREAGVRFDSLPKFADNWTTKGATVIGLAADESLLGLFALRDNLKPHAEQVVRTLAAQGKKTFLVTGDHARTAAAVAQQAGIAPDAVFAEVRPAQKAEIIERMQRGGERVAFVGDGINDAPALKQADLGIAVSRASDVAREAADVILLRSDIEAIPEAIGLAQATLRTIKQNLFWAFFYNAAAVPLAAMGFLSPVICAAAMGLSDLLVIGNALRLRRWRLKN